MRIGTLFQYNSSYGLFLNLIPNTRQVSVHWLDGDGISKHYNWILDQPIVTTIFCEEFEDEIQKRGSPSIY